MKVAFISCTKQKRRGCHPARQLYISPLFRLSWSYTSQTFDAVYILSAKHGLVNPGRRIRNYDVTLKRMPVHARRRWARKVAGEILEMISSDVELHLFCGKQYREFLVDALKPRKVFVPLKKLGLGRQLQWYKKRLHKERLTS
jgi:hypothetical protein